MTIHHTLIRIETIEEVDAVNEQDRKEPSKWSLSYWVDTDQFKKMDAITQAKVFKQLRATADDLERLFYNGD